MKNVLIVGKSGLLGTKTHETLIDRHRVGGVSRSGVGKNNVRLDITDRDAVEQFVERHSFDVVIHTAAITDVDYCRSNRDEAWETNVGGTKNLVFAIKNADTKLIYLSSDYIYSGDDPPYAEDAEPDPVNYYGLTKLEAERIIREELRDYAIVRPGKLYGFTEENGCDPFVEYVRESVEAADDPVTFDDHTVKYPTLIDDVVALIEELIADDQTGKYNVSGGEPVTKYEWAKAICDRYGLDQENVAPGRSSPDADRPHNVEYGLDAVEKLGLTVRTLQDGLDAMFMQETCTFRPIYRHDLADRFAGRSSSEIRRQLGGYLARSDDIEADVVVPVPQSGVYPGTGYANEAELPLEFGISKHNLRRRTLYDATLDRAELLEDRMTVIPEVIEDRDVVVVDEAILSGTTIESIVPKLRSAASIHLRISSPPVIRNCPVGVHPVELELFARRFVDDTNGSIVELQRQIRDEFGVDSVRFVPTEAYVDVVGDGGDVCAYCFHDGDRYTDHADSIRS